MHRQTGLVLWARAPAVLCKLTRPLSSIQSDFPLQHPAVHLGTDDSPMIRTKHNNLLHR